MHSERVLHRGKVKRTLHEPTFDQQTVSEFDFTLFLESYLSRMYSHRTYLILDILMCKMSHIKSLSALLKGTFKVAVLEGEDFILTSSHLNYPSLSDLDYHPSLNSPRLLLH